MIKWIKIFLAVILFLCLLDMPYGYFQFVRFASFLGFSLIAYDSFKRDGFGNEVIVFVALALLFQPFVKVALGRTIWNIVDVIVGVGLLVSVFRSENK